MQVYGLIHLLGRSGVSLWRESLQSWFVCPPAVKSCSGLRLVQDLMFLCNKRNLIL